MMYQHSNVSARSRLRSRFFQKCFQARGSVFQIQLQKYRVAKSAGFSQIVQARLRSISIIAEMRRRKDPSQDRPDPTLQPSYPRTQSWGQARTPSPSHMYLVDLAQNNSSTDDLYALAT